MDRVEQVIIDTIDTALSLFDFVDKDDFYLTLEMKYGLKPVDIPTNYDTFHKLLIETYGVKHFMIERQITRVLHKRSVHKIYRESEEIPAFAKIVKSYFEEVDHNFEESKRQIAVNTVKLNRVKKLSEKKEIDSS